MARILYGVQGVNHGHAMRALTLARHFGQHEFLFYSSDDAARRLAPEFRVERGLNLGTTYRDYRTDILGSIRDGFLKVLPGREEQLDRLARRIDEFQPDVAISDYEHFVPVAERRAGLPCLSLDHQHLLTCCKHEGLTPGQRSRLWLQSLSIRLFFSECRRHAVVAFQPAEVRPGEKATVFGPLLREAVLARTAGHGEGGGRILVYQSCARHRDFLPFLRSLAPRQFLLYGSGESRREGNVLLRPFSEDAFLDDLAGADYVICGGGHTLISEALYLGKPVLSYPILHEFEQELNALYLERLGLGRMGDMARLDPALVTDFEAALDTRRAAIASRNWLGNPAIFDFMGRYIQTGQIPGGTA